MGVVLMKKLFISMALVGAVFFAGQSSFAACGCADMAQEVTVKTPFYYYLNPLQYVGIGNNYSNFSLNPFNGFKNCNRAKVKKCDECTRVKIKPCPTCQKAFNDQPEWIYVQPVTPKCTSCGH